MIKIENLKFKYHPDQKNVIEIRSMEIRQGSIVLLVGKSGSGKSTLINLLAGLLDSNEGSIRINDTCLNQMKPSQINKFRANHIGLISQQFNLIPYLTVFENIQLARSFQNSKTKISEYELTDMMNQLKLSPYLIHSKCSELSVGQQQRVAIIRAIIHKPKLILADEPTSALDQHAKESFINVLIEMVQKNQMTLVFISHDMTIKKHFPMSLEMEALNVT